MMARFHSFLALAMSLAGIASLSAAAVPLPPAVKPNAGSSVGSPPAPEDGGPGTPENGQTEMPAEGDQGSEAAGDSAAAPSAGSDTAAGNPTTDDTSPDDSAGADEPDESASDDHLDDLDDLDELDELEDSGGSVTIKGFLANEFRYYLPDRDGPQNDERAISELQLEFGADLGGGVRALLRPWFLVDAVDTDLLRYEPLEAYLQIDGESWDLRGGQFIESWGITDTFNPLDVLNRRDSAVDMLNATGRGELGLRARVHMSGGETIGEGTLSLYVLPYWRPTDFPTRDSRFAVAFPAPIIGPLFLDDAAATRPDLENATFTALRLEHTLNTSTVNADLQYIVARGPGRFPSIAPDFTPPFRLVPEYYGELTVGAGFRAVPGGEALAPYTIKAEVSYKHSYELDTPVTALPESYLQYVAGVDRLLPAVFSQRDQLTLTVEYMGETGADDQMSAFRPFASDVAMRIAWDAGALARTAVDVRAIVDVHEAEVIGEAIVKRQLRFLHENLHAEVGGRWIRPAGDSFWNFFPKSSSLSGKLILDF